MLLPQSPKSLIALCALAILAVSSSTAEAKSVGENGLFDAYVSSRLRSYHAHVAPTSPDLELSRRSLTNPSSHASNPSRFSSLSSSSNASSSKPVYHLAPHVPTDAQVKVLRLENLKASSKNSGFTKKTKARARSSVAKRSIGPVKLEEVKRATTGQVEAREKKKLWVRAEPEDAEGDESAEQEQEQEEGADWSWMEHADEHEKEGEGEEEEGILSSAARMEIRMKRSIPLFHVDP